MCRPAASKSMASQWAKVTKVNGAGQVTQGRKVTFTVPIPKPATRSTKEAVGIGLVPDHPMSRGPTQAHDTRRNAQDCLCMIGREALQVVGGDAPTLQFSPPVSRPSSHNLKPLGSPPRVIFSIDSLEISPSTHSSTSRAPQDAARQHLEGLFRKSGVPSSRLIIAIHLSSNPPSTLPLFLEFCQQ